MTTSLYDPKVQHVLDEMHSMSESNDPPLLARAKGKVGSERAVLMEEAFIPVSRESGRFLYSLVRSNSGTVVEFGTSFGISTIYIAAAVRDRGEGKVITTELYESKASRARDYIGRTGLHEHVDLRVGDALETLKNVDEDLSIVFLDGMKQLYTPVLRLLEPSLRPGALVIGDDTELFPDELKPYLDYVRDPANGYVSVPVHIDDGMELSSRVG